MKNKFEVGQRVHCGIIIAITEPIFYLQETQKRFNCTMAELKEKFAVWNVKYPDWINSPVYRVYLNKPFVNPSFDDFVIRHKLDDIKEHPSLMSIYDSIKSSEKELMLPEDEIQPYDQEKDTDL